MARLGFPAEVIGSIRDSVDCNLFFFGKPVGIPAMYAILGGAVVLLVALYILLNVIRKKER